MDEISLFDAPPLPPMQRIAADFRAALEGTGLSYDTNMVQTETVSPQKSDPYERVILDVAGRKQPLFRPASKKGYIQCPPFVAAEMAKMGAALEPVPSSVWRRLPLSRMPKFEDCPGAAQNIFEAVIRQNGFGCCSRYLECSDAKHCVHPDIMTAARCAYRQNLMAGRIFYGRNKTIQGGQNL